MSQDLEKSSIGDKERFEVDAGPLEHVASVNKGDRITRLRRLLLGHVESRGVAPVPNEERTDRRGYSVFGVWFTSNFCLLPIATGMSGTSVMGLSLRDASLIIIFFVLIFTVPVAWLGMMGPKTGLRQMIQTRYYFGYYLATIVVILQLATLTGYTIIISIVSGQTLAALSSGHLSINVGIILIVILSLVVSFMGYRILHIFETWSWIPTLVALIATLAVGGKHPSSQAEAPPASARAVVTFGSIVASLSISWCAVVSDFAVYVSPTVPRYRTFFYVYAGYCLPSIPLLVLGAAIGGAVPTIPSLTAANNAYSVGGVMYAMVSPVGDFSKFIGVLLAFSVIGIAAATLYALSISLALLFPIGLLARVPRFLYAILIVAIVIPVAIVASTNFYASLSNFLGIIGYWTAVYAGIALAEHHYFRKTSYDSYDHAIWDVPGKLPVGFAALVSGLLCFALIVPSMDAVWYTGSIARHTGDIGIEVGIVLAVILFIPLRALEIRIFGR
ncbi:hypothetical protein LTR06_011223 [Exophiala xenobiotica]|nr:hypothetical protein LTR06_011223 [Exophiala xenobiotica]